MHRRRAVRGWLCLLLLALGSRAGAQTAPLYVVPTDDRLGVAVPLEQPLRVEFEAVDRERLLAALGPGAVAISASRVRFDVPADRDRPYRDDADGANRWLASTFMVDHDEAAVAALRQAFLAESGPGPVRIEALVAFVERKVEAEHGRAWEPASRTAQTLRGDCTEHAVLTAALARGLGIPARVVVGMVIVRPAGRYATYGHAWAELHHGDRWVVGDAALGATAAQARYVPLGLLEDEGPGFLLQVLDTLTAWVTRMDVPGPGG